MDTAYSSEMLVKVYQIVCNHTTVIFIIITVRKSNLAYSLFLFCLYRDVLLHLEECTHPTVMKDMCAECGADLRKQEQTLQNASIPMVHSIPELKVSKEVCKPNHHPVNVYGAFHTLLFLALVTDEH
jgi:hypothetical protein